VFFVHVTGDPANGAALAGSVAALKNDDHAPAGFFQIALQLNQFGLVGFQRQFLPVFLYGFFVGFSEYLQFIAQLPVFGFQAGQIGLLRLCLDQ